MNKVILSGNLTKDMDVRVNKNGTICGTFTLANNRGFGENKKSQFFNCMIYGERVGKLEQYLLKGTKVIVSGEIELTQVMEEGQQTKYYTNIFVNEIEIVKFVDSDSDFEEVKEEQPKQKYTKKSYLKR